LNPAVPVHAKRHGVKKLFDRLKRGSGAAAPEAADMPTHRFGFLSTQFLERGDELQVVATWTARAAEVGAKPMERKLGRADLRQAVGCGPLRGRAEPNELLRMSQYLQFVTVPVNQEVIGQDSTATTC